MRHTDLTAIVSAEGFQFLGYIVNNENIIVLDYGSKNKRIPKYQILKNHSTSGTMQSDSTHTNYTVIKLMSKIVCI